MYECPFCGKKTKSLNGLKMHIRENHDYQKIRCPVCRTQCRQIKALVAHCRARLRRNPGDVMHLSLYLLLHRNNYRGHGAKVPQQFMLLKNLKEVFKE